MPLGSQQASTGPDPLDIPGRRPLGSLLNVVIGVLIIAVLAVLGVTLLTGDDVIAVPDLLGLTAIEAAGRAAEAGLKLSDPDGLPIDQSQPRWAGDEDVRRVATQEPAPGTEIERGSTITVSLSVDAAQVAVPGLSGLSAAEAREALEATGLHQGALVADPTAGAAAGSVTRQDPAAGDLVPAGSTVKLWVAAAATVTVPDMNGLTSGQAESLAATTGLTLQVLREVTDEVMPGSVFKQSPEAGSEVTVGSVVVIVVNGAAGAEPAPGAPAGGGGTADTTPSAGSTDGSAADLGREPASYRALAAAFPFPVLYPSRVPPTLSLDPSVGNPRQMTDQEGSPAFEVRYVDPVRPWIRLSLIEGGLFELGIDEATTVDVRGFPASLGTAGTTVVISWQEGSTPYMVAAEGLEAGEVVAFASGLVAVIGR